MSGKPEEGGLSRRGFLKGAALAAAGPWVLPSWVLGMNGRTAPSDRITTAYIGNGGWGGGVHVAQDALRDDIEVVAVCDVWRDRRERAKKKVEDAYAERKRLSQYGGVRAYNDFREILARPDVDAVVIAPLHYWHAVMGILAAQAGKHIYVEKMYATTLGEAQALAQAVQRHGIVSQHGTQGRSMATFRHATELAQNGRTGKILRVEATCLDGCGTIAPGQRRPLGAGTSTAREVPVPEGLDWDLYLGPCPWKPYTGDLNDVGGFGFSMLADFGIHPMDSAQMILDVRDSRPIEVYPGGTGGYDKVTIRYASGAEVTRPGARASWGEDAEFGDFGVRVIGSEGTIAVDRNGCHVHPAHLDRRPIGPDDWRYNPNAADPVARATSSVVAPNSRGTVGFEDSWAGVGAHKSNWFHCIRTGQRTNAHEDYARRSASACILIHMAYALGRPLKWDPQREEFIGDDEANRLRDYPKRAPWQVY